jgi:hypothetical protein
MPLLLALLAHPAHALPPQEEAALARGEVVVHELPPTRPGAVRLEAWVDIAADSPATWRALTDYAARERSSETLTGYSIYRQETDRLCIRWTGARFGMSLVFHNCYGMKAARTELTHTLDPDRPSDLAYTTGTYKLAPGPKGTRLHYRSETDFGKPMPGFVKGWLGSSGAREYMLDTKKRAEAR